MRTILFSILSPICICFYSLQGSQANAAQSAVSYVELEKGVQNLALEGRFGDCLLYYIHAKWISYQYGIPLLYKPFRYSNLLVLDQEETRFKELDWLRFSKVIVPSAGEKILYEKEKSILYAIPFFPESSWELSGDSPYYQFPVNWKDKKFKEELKRLIKPVTSTSPIYQLPNDRITVAVHVRRGGGFDALDIWKRIPMKFPPNSYYIEQIQRIYETFGNQPLFVHVFTDDPNPSEIANLYQKSFPDKDIQFSCRGQGNYHNLNVVEDFFEMLRFDCLIRADSNYSIVASRLGNYKLVMSPKHFIKKGDDFDSVYIDEVEIEIGENFTKQDSSIKKIEILENYGLKKILSFQKNTQEEKVHFSFSSLSKLSPSAHKIFLFDSNLPISYLKELPKQLVYFQVDANPLPDESKELFSRIYTWDDDLVDGVKFFKLYPPNLKAMEENPYSFQEKNLCILMADEDGDWLGRKDHSWTRMRLVEFFEGKPKGDFDLYGQSWTRRCYRDYKGPIPNSFTKEPKQTLLKKYRFSICFEEMGHTNGYISEKIFSSFASGCVPVYLGAKNIESYIPKDCFIDYRDFPTLEALYQHMKTMTQKEHETYIKNIRTFLKSPKANLFSQKFFSEIVYQEANR